jgi:hypothetical protein
MEKNRICKFCSESFVPHPSVPFQEYCGDPPCQKARKRIWKKEKMANDPDYKENQKKSQKNWQSKNKDYWRNYRRKNLRYTHQNRIQQKERNQRRFAVIAKSDELTPGSAIISGVFKLVPVCNGKIANGDEVIVSLNVISRVSANLQPSAP